MQRVIRISGMLAAALCCVAAGAGPAWAAFEDLEVSPRARALGGAWAAVTRDDFAPFHNPASLAWTARVAGAASYFRPFGYDFSSQSAVAGSIVLPRRLGGLGFGVRRFGVDYQGESLMNETTVALAHGFHLINDRQSELAVGWGLNLYTLDFGRSVTGIDPGSASNIGVNLGATAVLRDRTRVGFQVLNLNNPNIGHRDKEELRRRISVGVSYAPYPGVETVLDIANELGATFQYRGGAEFEIADFAWFRAGVRTEPSAFTAGLSLRKRDVSFDYGFSTGGGVLSETHHFGVGVVLPGPE
jgi:hypothetical protein